MLGRGIGLGCRGGGGRGFVVEVGVVVVTVVFEVVEEEAFEVVVAVASLVRHTGGATAHAWVLMLLLRLSVWW